MYLLIKLSWHIGMLQVHFNTQYEYQIGRDKLQIRTPNIKSTNVLQITFGTIYINMSMNSKQTTDWGIDCITRSCENLGGTDKIQQ